MIEIKELGGLSMPLFWRSTKEIRRMIADPLTHACGIPSSITALTIGD